MQRDMRAGVEIDAALMIEEDELPAPAVLRRAVREARPRQRIDIEVTTAGGSGRKVIVAFIRFYQRRLSKRLNRRCVLEPSCSRYAELAITQNGLLRGGRETWRRLRRCRPENEGTIDYPEGVLLALPSNSDRTGVQRQVPGAADRKPEQL